MRRDRAGTDLTTDGAKVLEQAVRITDAYGELMDDLRSSSAPMIQEGSLRIAASPTLGHYWLPRALPQWQAALPDITIETRVFPRRKSLRRLSQGRADLALVEQPPANEDLVPERMGSHRLLATCHRSHPWAGRDSIGLADFLRAPLVLRAPGCELRDRLERRLRQEGHPPLRADRVVGSQTNLLTHLHQGEHLTVTSSLALAGGLDRELIPLPIRDLDLNLSLWAVRAPQTPVSEGLATCLAHLRSHPVGEDPVPEHPPSVAGVPTADPLSG
ncbi:MAG: substrate-binding domain-containing protein [Thiohalorhabdus sp.]|uniref:substrate-binding domain-containing protein n=1 Tax=Thiohalorhabdus sp. TaxID=3094134 RepID=UPI002FC37814